MTTKTSTVAEFEKTAVTVFLMCVFNGNGRIILLCFELPEVEDPRRWQVVTGAKKEKISSHAEMGIGTMSFQCAPVLPSRVFGYECG